MVSAFWTGLTATAVSSARAPGRARGDRTIVGEPASERVDQRTNRTGRARCGVTNEAWLLMIGGCDDGLAVRRRVSERRTLSRTATGQTTRRRRPSDLAH